VVPFFSYPKFEHAQMFSVPMHRLLSVPSGAKVSLRCLTRSWSDEDRVPEITLRAPERRIGARWRGVAPGVASQIAVSHFRRAVSRSEAINDLLTRYHMALMCQVQQTSLCNSVHDATSRLSRLLLVLSEQGKDDTISFSQERLAQMLGLRRSSVTLAAQTLQSRRLISYRRGRIQIVNRTGLKAAACECYEVVSRTFEHFLEHKQVKR
jgi:hypothetical protein